MSEISRKVSITIQNMTLDVRNPGRYDIILCKQIPPMTAA